MEHITIEGALIQENAVDTTDAPIRDLGELQLALVGGGIGDAIAA